MADRLNPARKCRNAVTRFCNEAHGSAYVCGYARRNSGNCDLESVVESGLNSREAASLLGTMLGKYAEAHDWDAPQILGFLFAMTAERDNILRELAAEESE